MSSTARDAVLGADALPQGRGPLAHPPVVDAPPYRPGEPLGGEPPPRHGRGSDAQPLHAAAPEGLVAAGGHDDGWPPRPQAFGCGSCSPVVDDRRHPGEEPIVGRLPDEERVLGGARRPRARPSRRIGRRARPRASPPPARSLRSPAGPCSPCSRSRRTPAAPPRRGSAVAPRRALGRRAAGTSSRRGGRAPPTQGVWAAPRGLCHRVLSSGAAESARMSWPGTGAGRASPCAIG